MKLLQGFTNFTGVFTITQPRYTLYLVFTPTVYSDRGIP